MKARFTALLLVLSGCAILEPVPDLDAMSTEDLLRNAAARPHYRSEVLARLKTRLAWSDLDHRRIEDRKVWIGASEDQVLCSWGHPASESTHISAYGTTKYWRYGSVFSTHTMVAMTDGKVTDINRSD